MNAIPTGSFPWFSGAPSSSQTFVHWFWLTRFSMVSMVIVEAGDGGMRENVGAGRLDGITSRCFSTS
ncbi:MAG: hypothetical protein IPF99_21525 [Deltaproteobacteria bacterium]|nr:hypothetical protein [Deltaproteobacteria bacterium]